MDLLTYTLNKNINEILLGAPHIYIRIYRLIHCHVLNSRSRRVAFFPVEEALKVLFPKGGHLNLKGIFHLYSLLKVLRCKLLKSDQLKFDNFNSRKKWQIMSYRISDSNMIVRQIKTTKSCTYWNTHTKCKLILCLYMWNHTLQSLDSTTFEKMGQNPPIWKVFDPFLRGGALICDLWRILGQGQFVKNIAKGTTDPGVDCFDQ